MLSSDQALSLIDDRLGLSKNSREALLLREVAELMSKETDAEAAGSRADAQDVEALLSEAVEHTAAKLQQAAADGGDDDALCLFWTFLWDQLWRRTEFEKTVPYPREWHRLALPFLWLQHHHPENFHAFAATRGEQLLIDAALEELQVVAAKAGYPVRSEAPIIIWTDPLLEEYSRLANLVGTAAVDFAPPHGLVLLSADYLETVRPPAGYWCDHLAGMITHEIIHLHWSEIYPEGEDFPGLVLHHALEEAVTTLLEQLIHYQVSQTAGGRNLQALSESLTKTGYPIQADNLLRLLYTGSGLDPWQHPELLWTVMKHVCSEPEEARLAVALNAEFMIEHPLRWWREQFSMPYLRVCSQSMKT